MHTCPQLWQKLLYERTLAFLAVSKSGRLFNSSASELRVENSQGGGCAVRTRKLEVLVSGGWVACRPRPQPQRKRHSWEAF